jgi:hypothetical protein
MIALRVGLSSCRMPCHVGLEEVTFRQTACIRWDGNFQVSAVTTEASRKNRRSEHFPGPNFKTHLRHSGWRDGRHVRCTINPGNESNCSKSRVAVARGVRSGTARDTELASGGDRSGARGKCSPKVGPGRGGVASADFASTVVRSGTGFGAAS